MHPLLDPFERNHAATPKRCAICDPELALDYATLRGRAGGLAQQLQAQTERPRVGILAPTSAATATAILGCWYAGKVPVPLNFLLGPVELGRIVRDAELDLVLAAEHFLHLAETAGLRALPLTAPTLVPANRPAPHARVQDVGVLLYTSGTSGDPKGVALSFDNLVQNANACIQHARIASDEVFLSVLPQFHSFGFTAMTVTPLLAGGTVYYLPRFSPVSLLNALADQRPTILMAIPSMYAALGSVTQAERHMFAPLKLTISGGEPLPERVYRLFQERFGVTIYEGYGLTESSPVVTLNTPWAHRPHSVGRPIPGVSVSAADERGSYLPAGQDGELIVRGHCVMLGYHNQPQATAAVIRDGALWTGDVGHLDADGFVYITGRAKEMMIVGGENVFPAEIENVLLDHPAVQEVAVIGVRDEVRGELPAAFVVLKPGKQVAESELREFCRGRLARYKVPRRVRLVTSLPRSPTGKVLRRALTLETW